MLKSLLLLPLVRNWTTLKLQGPTCHGLRLEVTGYERKGSDVALRFKLANVSNKAVIFNSIVMSPEAMRIRFLDKRHNLLHYEGDNMAEAFPDKIIRLSAGSEYKIQSRFHFRASQAPRFLVMWTAYPVDGRFPGIWSGELHVNKSRLF